MLSTINIQSALCEKAKTVAKYTTMGALGGTFVGGILTLGLPYNNTPNNSMADYLTTHASDYGCSYQSNNLNCFNLTQENQLISAAAQYDQSTANTAKLNSAALIIGIGMAVGTFGGFAYGLYKAATSATVDPADSVSVSEAESETREPSRNTLFPVRELYAITRAQPEIQNSPVAPSNRLG